MMRASLISLDDAVIDKVLSKLVKICGLARTIASICLINTRFAALVRQPLEAWETVLVRKASPVGAAYLARWLACVAPAVEKLSLDIYAAAPCFACLAGARGLKELDVRGPHLMAADLALVGIFTSLTVLRCDCHLAGSVKALSSLASLKQLQRLSLTAYKAPVGVQLPPSLSALSALQSLSLTVAGRRLTERMYLRLPWEWCLTATQVTSMQLESVDLPLFPGPNQGRNMGGASIGSSGASSGSIFPALRRLELHSAFDRIPSMALGCCQAVKHLQVQLSQTCAADWAVLSNLSQLQTLIIDSCYVEAGADVDDNGEPLPLPQSLSGLTSLTKLEVRESTIHPAMAKLPAVRDLRLWVADRGSHAAAGWALPEGPWLHNLEKLDIFYGEIGSIDAALRQATRLHTLSLHNCYWLCFRRSELQLLLRLPLKRFMLSKRPESDEDDLPEPLWDTQSRWVVQELRKALKRGVFLEV